MEMKVTKWDDDLTNGLTNYTYAPYTNDTDNYSVVPFRPKINPANHWCFPAVTSHKYKIHWRNGLDFTKMQMDVSEKWNSSDLSIHLVFNFSDVRAAVEMRTGNDLIPNNTINTKANADY